MDYMVKESHPNPEKAENSGNDSRRQFAFTKGQNEGNNTEYIRQYLDRPDGCIVGCENVEELLNRERYFHCALLISIPLRTSLPCWFLIVTCTLSRTFGSEAFGE